MNNKQFEREFVAATRRGKASQANLPRARSARYDSRAKRLVLEMQNGVTMLVPVSLIQGLQQAHDAALANFELAMEGTQIHWCDLDVQMYVGSLIDGVFGTPAWMQRLRRHYSTIGAKGGRSRSPIKLAAAKENGKKGGRPRKRVVG